jgi:hypothetical protein
MNIYIIGSPSGSGSESLNLFETLCYVQQNLQSLVLPELTLLRIRCDSILPRADCHSTCIAAPLRLDSGTGVERANRRYRYEGLQTREEEAFDLESPFGDGLESIKVLTELVNPFGLYAGAWSRAEDVDP